MFQPVLAFEHVPPCSSKPYGCCTMHLSPNSAACSLWLAGFKLKDKLQGLPVVWQPALLLLLEVGVSGRQDACHSQLPHLQLYNTSSKCSLRYQRCTMHAGSERFSTDLGAVRLTLLQLPLHAGQSSSSCSKSLPLPPGAIPRHAHCCNKPPRCAWLPWKSASLPLSMLGPSN